MAAFNRLPDLRATEDTDGGLYVWLKRPGRSRDLCLGRIGKRQRLKWEQYDDQTLTSLAQEWAAERLILRGRGTVH